MDNIVKVRILGTEFKVSTDKGEEHAVRIAEAVDAKAREIMEDDQYLPSTRAALIAAMDFCESELKYRRVAMKLKKRLEKATEELERSPLGDSGYLEEITVLEEKVASAEKTAAKKDDEIASLKEELALLEGYRERLAATEKELEEAYKINGELENALKAAEDRVSEYTADIDESDFDLEEDDDDDVIIPGYLDGDDEQSEGNVENPFGLDFGA